MASLSATEGVTLSLVALSPDLSCLVALRSLSSDTSTSPVAVADQRAHIVYQAYQATLATADATRLSGLQRRGGRLAARNLRIASSSGQAGVSANLQVRFGDRSWVDEEVIVIPVQQRSVVHYFRSTRCPLPRDIQYEPNAFHWRGLIQALDSQARIQFAHRIALHRTWAMAMELTARFDREHQPSAPVTTLLVPLISTLALPNAAATPFAPLPTATPAFQPHHDLRFPIFCDPNTTENPAFSVYNYQLYATSVWQLDNSPYRISQVATSAYSLFRQARPTVDWLAFRQAWHNNISHQETRADCFFIDRSPPGLNLWQYFCIVGGLWFPNVYTLVKIYGRPIDGSISVSSVHIAFSPREGGQHGRLGPADTDRGWPGLCVRARIDCVDNRNQLRDFYRGYASNRLDAAPDECAELMPGMYRQATVHEARLLPAGRAMLLVFDSPAVNVPPPQYLLHFVDADISRRYPPDVTLPIPDADFRTARVFIQFEERWHDPEAVYRGFSPHQAGDNLGPLGKHLSGRSALICFPQGDHSRRTFEVASFDLAYAPALVFDATERRSGDSRNPPNAGLKSIRGKRWNWRSAPYSGTRPIR